MRRGLIVALVVVALAGCNKPLSVSTGPSGLSTPPVIQTFTADATRLNSPFLDTFLRWDVIGAGDTRCRIDSFDQPSQQVGNVALAGFVQIRPQVSRDYTLQCTNASGTVIRVVHILVG